MVDALNSNAQLSGLDWQGDARFAKLQQLQHSYQTPGTDQQKKLKKAAQEFEAVFVNQMLEAMDKTVDRQDGLLSGGSAEQYFRSMLNDEISKSMTSGPGGSGFGLAESIYRQMSQNLNDSASNSETGKQGEVKA